MPGRMQGKSVLVMGGGALTDGWSNGKAAAVLYAREGARVMVADKDLAAAKRTQAIILGEGGQAEVLRADVTVNDDMAQAATATREAFGRIDVLHNNVGIIDTGGAVEASEQSWNHVIATNQTGIFLACKHVLPIMVEQNKGAVVNISSVAGVRWLGFPYIAYSASKAAILAMTQNIALQYAKQGIRANCVLPGLLNTPMIREPLAANYGAGVAEMLAIRDAQSPTGKMGDAWDTAYASLFLASDEAKYVNGTQIIVDGGLSCKTS
ncbi:MAG: SDR family NAD(P)-dependent oxidoreductase [Quisquiliibacterium sp.]